MKLILGSSSKYRKQILDREGYVFDVVSPDVDEKAIKVDGFYERPMVLARAKALAVASKITEPAIIIAADQVTVCVGELREKPESERETRKWLESYSAGDPVESINALVVINTKTGEKFEGIDSSKVFFKNIPEDARKEFIEKNEPHTRAGGFGVQNTALTKYVDHIDGTEDSVVGMPIKLLRELLNKAGFQKD